MFKTTFNQMIDSVQDAKKTFVESYFFDSYKEPALAIVESQRSLAKTMTESVDKFVTETTATAKEVFKV